ncbi:hypothetical protein GIB67_018136 [Kingdonia uniflora]|uniref:Uncharacterized protein n=1 Tax=Kingdonia uniflora TaxID=39325 RepID=A0A7J7NMD2_9MAGN|nr:hypothetical protein GIB67_018136 [Kingdonia uniflora]
MVSKFMSSPVLSAFVLNPMKGTLRYLAGLAGPNGFGSNSTADQVTEDSSSTTSFRLTTIYHCLYGHILYLLLTLNIVVKGGTSGIGA